MPHRAAVSLPLLALLIAGCGDDTAGTADADTGAMPSTGTTADPTTGPAPTSSSSTSSTTAGSATEGETLGTTTTTTTDPTTSGVDPSTTTTDATTSTSSSSTDESSTGTSSTGDFCAEDTAVCDGDTAIFCKGRVPVMEECQTVCVDGVGCVTCPAPAPEVCDGLDNDCDGEFDEDAACAAGSCFGGGGQCSELSLPPLTPLVSGCVQQFPPAASLPCPIAEPGPQFHVRPDGDDAADGTTPATAWKTLCHAVDAAPAGSTLRVAEGQYAASDVHLAKALTVKGGYDATFTTWDPDAHPTLFHGRLTLDHNAAVFGGFRVISNPLTADAWSYGHHFIGAGTLVRNYIEIVATAGDDPDILNFYGIVASACPAGVTVLRCNDIYVRSSAPQTFVVSAIEYGNHALHAGQAVLDANRICQDGGTWATDAVGGYGSCFPEPVSLLLRNNVIEKTGSGGEALSFYSCGEGDMDLTLTNNTILTAGDGVRSSGDPLVTMRWKLTNNLVFNPTGAGPSAIDVGGAGVEITTSEGNLTFGFQSNAILPPPLASAGDDTSGVATPMSVFVDAAGGDLRPAPGGQADATGLNVFGLPDYGLVTTDLTQTVRSPDAPWARGALDP